MFNLDILTEVVNIKVPIFTKGTRLPTFLSPCRLCRMGFWELLFCFFCLWSQIDFWRNFVDCEIWMPWIGHLELDSIWGNYEFWKMWILEKCEFWKMWILENVNVGKMWILEKCECWTIVNFRKVGNFGNLWILGKCWILQNVWHGLVEWFFILVF